MKEISIFAIVILLFFSCQFNQSINKDLKTGAYSRGNGIGCDEVRMEINGKTDARNEFIYGEKVNIIFNDVKGLSVIENKTHPNMSIYIVKNDKDTLLSNDNLLKESKKGTELSPLQLRTYFTTVLPHRNNEKYKTYINIWDEKGDGKFTYELPFTIKENELLTIKNNGIKYSNVYLWNETLQQPVIDKNVSSDDLLIFILNGVGGLKEVNKKIFPIFSIEIIDANNRKILSNDNMLSDYKEGLNPDDIKNKLIAKITLPKRGIENPCKVFVKLKDKNSAKEINITTELNVE